MQVQLKAAQAELKKAEATVTSQAEQLSSVRAELRGTLAGKQKQHHTKASPVPMWCRRLQNRGKQCEQKKRYSNDRFNSVELCIPPLLDLQI